MTSYPLVENIQTSVEPFQKLYGNVLRWQRAEKRWMDGEFLKLESEVIEAEVDEFWREIYKGKHFLKNRKVLWSVESGDQWRIRDDNFDQNQSKHLIVFF